MSVRILAIFVLVGSASARGQVFSSEFNSFPLDEGWDLVQQFCDPTTFLEDGRYVQILNFDACGPPPGGGQDSYALSIQEFNGELKFYAEFRVETNGDRSEIPGGAPTVVAMGNSFGTTYHTVVSTDQVRLLRDVLLPQVFVTVQSGIPHTVRLELRNSGIPTYIWYIDGQIVDQGFAEGPFPSQESLITWRGKASFLPCQNWWSYIRFGVIPVDASGDWDSSGTVDGDDLPFFVECLQESGEGVDAGPGCRWADMDSDTDVDCTDWDAFQLVWDDPTPPDALPECPEIPTMSTWVATIMALLLLSGGTILFKGRRQPECCR